MVCTRHLERDCDDTHHLTKHENKILDILDILDYNIAKQ